MEQGPGRAVLGGGEVRWASFRRTSDPYRRWLLFSQIPVPPDQLRIGPQQQQLFLGGSQVGHRGANVRRDGEPLSRGP